MNKHEEQIEEFNKKKMEYIENVEEHQYLTFVLSDEIFAIEVLRIKEIIGLGQITPVPTMPEYIEGVINVRGNVVPVVSLAKRFKLALADVTHRTCIIIVSAHVEGDILDVGLIVDMVNQVYDILPSHIESTPMFGSAIRKDFIQKVGKVNNKFISILDIEGITSLQEISLTDDKQYI